MEDLGRSHQTLPNWLKGEGAQLAMKLLGQPTPGILS